MGTVDRAWPAGELDQDVVARLLEIDGTGEALCAVAALFIRDAPGQVEALAGAVAKGDIDGVRTCAHTIRGSAATFGARRLALLSGRMEHEASKGTLPHPKDDVPRLSAALDVAVDQLTELMRHYGFVPKVPKLT